MDHHAILLVDDEQGLVKMLQTVLQKEGFHLVDSVFSGATAIKKVEAKQYDLIVLDVMLPDIDGFEVCRRIRDFSYTPILFLTAKTSDLDKLTGLGIGGDDYITKPFNPLEVVARIKAHFRREEVYQYQSKNLEQKIEYGNLHINKTEALVTLSGQKIELTAKELELLVFFAEHPNQIFTATQLYEKVWGMDSNGDDKIVTVYVMRLRKRLEAKPHKPQLFINLRGIGYKFHPGGQY